jgi:hypothetical protein
MIKQFDVKVARRSWLDAEEKAKFFKQNYKHGFWNSFLALQIIQKFGVGP